MSVIFDNPHLLPTTLNLLSSVMAFDFAFYIFFKEFTLTSSLQEHWSIVMRLKI